MLYRFRQFDLLAFAVRDDRVEVQVATHHGEIEHER